MKNYLIKLIGVFKSSPEECDHIYYPKSSPTGALLGQECIVCEKFNSLADLGIKPYNKEDWQMKTTDETLRIPREPYELPNGMLVEVTEAKLRADGVTVDVYITLTGIPPALDHIKVELQIPEAQKETK